MVTENNEIHRLPRKLKKEIKQVCFPSFNRISFTAYLLMYYFIKRSAYIAAIEHKTSLKNINWTVSNSKDIKITDDNGKELRFNKS
jgi:hypothetical protein